MKIKCKKCKEVKEDELFYTNKKKKNGKGSYCKECTKGIVKEWLLARPEIRTGYSRKYRKMYPNKYRAHRAVQKKIERGGLKKGLCEICGSPETRAHHDDYNKPLEIRWLCQLHHNEVHKLKVSKNNN